MNGPIEQEQALGHELLELVENEMYAEVSLYNGKMYVSVRRWFQADDGKYYRTKNGLHLRYDTMIEVLARNAELIAFVQKRAQEVESEHR